MTEAELSREVGRIARRVARLFRIERDGGFERRSLSTAARLAVRRGLLLDRLMQLEIERREAESSISDELRRSMAALAGEIWRARGSAAAEVDRLAGELRLGRGHGRATGLRDGGGRLLGQS